eukprot:352589_1
MEKKTNKYSIYRPQHMLATTSRWEKEKTFIVYGYIRKLIDTLALNIPSAIIKICFDFYFEMIDRFAKMHSDLTLSSDELTVSHTGGLIYRNAYGTIPIHTNENNNDTFQWKLTVNDLPVSNGDIFIGISTHRKTESNYASINYGYQAFYGLIWRSGGSTGKYGTKVRAGDTVLMTLDLDTKQLSFVINEEKKKVALVQISKLEQIYYLAVSINQGGESATINEFYSYAAHKISET